MLLFSYLEYIMNQIELKNMIDEIHVMADILSDEPNEDVRKDVMVAISVTEQKNLFWMVDSIEKLRGHIRRKKYELTDEDRLWSKEKSFGVCNVRHACEMVLFKCGWKFDHLNDIWSKKYKIDSYVEYRIEPDLISKNCFEIPMEAVIVNNIPGKYKIDKMTDFYIDCLIRNVSAIKAIEDDWYMNGFKKESVLLLKLWNDVHDDIKIITGLRI